MRREGRRFRTWTSKKYYLGGMTGDWKQMVLGPVGDADRTIDI